MVKKILIIVSALLLILTLILFQHIQSSSNPQIILQNLQKQLGVSVGIKEGEDWWKISTGYKYLKGVTFSNYGKFDMENIKKFFATERFSLNYSNIYEGSSLGLGKSTLLQFEKGKAKCTIYFYNDSSTTYYFCGKIIENPGWKIYTSSFNSKNRKISFNLKYPEDWIHASYNHPRGGGLDINYSIYTYEYNRENSKVTKGAAVDIMFDRTTNFDNAIYGFKPERWLKKEKIALLGREAFHYSWNDSDIIIVDLSDIEKGLIVAIRLSYEQNSKDVGKYKKAFETITTSFKIVEQ